MNSNVVALLILLFAVSQSEPQPVYARGCETLSLTNPMYVHCQLLSEETVETFNFFNASFFGKNDTLSFETDCWFNRCINKCPKTNTVNCYRPRLEREQDHICSSVRLLRTPFSDCLRQIYRQNEPSIIIELFESDDRKTKCSSITSSPQVNDIFDAVLNHCGEAKRNSFDEILQKIQNNWRCYQIRN